jgi:hypothetical protein
MGRFLEYDSGRSVATKKILSGTPSSKSFTHGCAKGFWGEYERQR